LKLESEKNPELKKKQEEEDADLEAGQE